MADSGLDNREAISEVTTGESEMNGEKNVFEPSFQSVLMDHEYECYTVWDELLEEMTAQDIIDSFHCIGAIDNEVEIQDEPSCNVNCQVDQDVTIDSQTNLNIPPSPGTANLQEILQLSYNLNQEHEIEEIICDELSGLNSNHIRKTDTHLHHLRQKIFNGIQTGTTNPDILMDANSNSEITSGLQDNMRIMSSKPITLTYSENLFSCGSSVIPDLNTTHDMNFADLARPAFIKNSDDRRQRFTSGLSYISTKIRKMRLRTGAMTIGCAQYEFDVYRYVPSAECFELLASDTNAEMLNHDISESSHATALNNCERDDHRYAAQIVEQTGSSFPIPDHQYENIQTRLHPPGLDRRTEATGGPSFEKRTYERNKSFLGHLNALFSDTVKKFEDQTRAIVSLTVYYQDEVFTKANYKDASFRFTRKGIRHSSVSTSPLAAPTVPTKLKFSEGGGGLDPIRQVVSKRGALLQHRISDGSNSSHKQYPSVNQMPPSSSSYNGNQPLTNSNPICLKCNSITPMTNFGDTSGVAEFVAWVRCNDPLCNYLVHAACLGFCIISKKQLKTLPHFWCENHRE